VRWQYLPPDRRYVPPAVKFHYLQFVTIQLKFGIYRSIAYYSNESNLIAVDGTKPPHIYK